MRIVESITLFVFSTESPNDSTKLHWEKRYLAVGIDFQMKLGA